MNIYLIIIVAIYMTTIALFLYYAMLNVKQTKTVEEWNDKTDVEIAALKGRNLDLEKRLAKLENELNGSVIEAEPDFEVKR